MKRNFELLIKCTRAYSLPISITSWACAFVFSLLRGGDIYFGLLALLGIVCAHLGSNMFDDFLDYKRHLKEHNELQKGKCSYFLNNEISQKAFLTLNFALFGAAVLIGLFFAAIYKLPVLLLMIITGVLCLIYPKSSYSGFGEIIIGTIFAPLLFSGVYLVMTGGFSKSLLFFSIPFGIFVVTLLYVHSFMDFNYDVKDGKKTICTLCKNRKNAYVFLYFLTAAAYVLIFGGILFKILPPSFSLTFLSIFPKSSLLCTLREYIDKDPESEDEFLKVFKKAQNLTVIFTILSVLSMLLSKTML